ncbi:MAG: hypothetical protein AAF715_07505 [Myxococcota bacterium]
MKTLSAMLSAGKKPLTGWLLLVATFLGSAPSCRGGRAHSSEGTPSPRMTSVPPLVVRKVDELRSPRPKKREEPLNLVDPDGVVLGSIDFHRWREAGLERLFDRFILGQGKSAYATKVLKTACALRFDEIFDRTAFSVLEDEDPGEHVLLVAQVRQGRGELMRRCERALRVLPPSPLIVEGTPCYRSRLIGTSLFLGEGTVVFGTEDAVARVVRRHRGEARGAEGRLRSRVIADRAAGMTVDAPGFGSASGNLDVSSGRLTLRVSAEADPRRPGNMRTAWSSTIRTMDDRIEVVFPARHGFRTRASQRQTISGRHYRLDWAWPLDWVRPSAVDNAIARWRHHNFLVEMRNNLGAAARTASMTYEGPRKKLCASAIDVPTTVPSASVHATDASAGRDFQTGDDTRGWNCIGFNLTAPTPFQYAYRQGGDYKGPARGLPDPGPDGFEVSAEGDLDGDGVTSLHTMVGSPWPKRSLNVTGVWQNLPEE